MENNLDLKQELQQDLRDLQQDIANHSTFNNEVWRRSVRRRVLGLYRLKLACSVFLIIFKQHQSTKKLGKNPAPVYISN